MKVELQKELYKRFPEILERTRYKDGNERYPYPMFGIECGDGWFGLIKDLLNSINTLCSQLRVTPPLVLQIKEKFGTLRFYCSSIDIPEIDEKIRDFISKAEEDSSHICELCGEKGKESSVGGRWIKTICKKCLKLINRRDK